MAFRTHCEELESSGAYSGNAEVMPDDRCHDGAEYLYGVQHCLVWKRRDTHLECDAGDAGANEGFGGAADTDPYRQRILQRARVDRLAGKSRAVFAGPVHLRACPNFQEKIEFFSKKRVVIFKTQAEEGVGLNERTTSGDDFGAAPGDEVESRELLKNTNGGGGTENRNCAGETDIFRARGGSGEDHNGC